MRGAYPSCTWHVHVHVNEYEHERLPLRSHPASLHTDFTLPEGHTMPIRLHARRRRPRNPRNDLPATGRHLP